jgi:hypothetical protein
MVTCVLAWEIPLFIGDVSFKAHRTHKASLYLLCDYSASKCESSGLEKVVKDFPGATEKKVQK